MTTGMSAPPIGSTNMTPKSSASRISATTTHCPCAPAMAAMPSAAAAARIAALTTFWPEKTIGRPWISSCSLANATSEPAKEIEPISAESTIETASVPPTRPGSGAIRWNSASAISAAAPPPTPLNRATICGIAVIFTLRAPTTPTTEPTTPAGTINVQLPMPSSSSVVTIAISIPAPPTQFPRRAWRGEERKRSARTKQTIVAR